MLLTVKHFIYAENVSFTPPKLDKTHQRFKIEEKERVRNFQKFSKGR